MSDVLRSDNNQTVKDAIGFVCVYFLSFDGLGLGYPSHTLLANSQLCRGDDGFKATAYLLEAAKAAAAAAESGAGKKARPAMNIAFGFEEHVFDWFASPAQAWRGQRMGRAMQQLHRMANGNVVTGTIALKWGGGVIGVPPSASSPRFLVLRSTSYLIADSIIIFVVGCRFQLACPQLSGRRCWRRHRLLGDEFDEGLPRISSQVHHLRYPPDIRER